MKLLITGTLSDCSRKRLPDVALIFKKQIVTLNLHLQLYYHNKTKLVGYLWQQLRFLFPHECLTCTQLIIRNKAYHLLKLIAAK